MMTIEQGSGVPHIPIQFWVIKKADGRPMFLLREDVGAIDRWDPRIGSWVPDQEMIDEIYSTDSWDTYAVPPEGVDRIKAALSR